MNERVEEIRRKWADAIFKLNMKPSNVMLDGSLEDIADVRDLLTALAQAERERDKAKEYSANDYRIRKATETELLETRAEVERLKVRVDDWKARPEHVCPRCEYTLMCDANERAKQAEADLARVRAAVMLAHPDSEHCECCSLFRAALEGR